MEASLSLLLILCNIVVRERVILVGSVKSVFLSYTDFTDLIWEGELPSAYADLSLDQPLDFQWRAISLCFANVLRVDLENAEFD